MNPGWYRQFSPAALFVAFLAITFPLWSNAYLTAPDSASYFAIPRSIVRDGDLDFLNDYEALRFRPRYVYLTDTGRLSNDWPVGTGLTWIPVYTVGEVAARVFSLAGLEGHRFSESDPPRDGLLPRPLTAGWDEPALAPTGQSGVYRLVVSVFVLVVAGLGLWSAYLVVQPAWGRWASFWAMIAVILGTPVGYYVYSFGMMSHATSMGVAGGFVYTWHRTRAVRSLQAWAFLGILAGLGVAIRPQNVLFLSVFVVELCFRRPGTAGGWVEYLRGAGVAAAGAVVAFSPQMIVWWCLYGNPLQLPKLEEMHWFSPQIGKTLFSDYHGLVAWSPLLALVPVGLGLLWRRDRCLAAALGVVLLLQLYVNSSNEFWWSSGSFGNRRFVDCGAIFVVAIAIVFGSLRRVYTIPVAVVLVSWNVGWWGLERSGGIVLERYIPWSGDLVVSAVSMLRPDRLFAGLLGDFSGFGWVFRIGFMLVGLGVAALIQLRRLPEATLWRMAVLSARAAALYLVLVPVVFVVAAVRTPSRSIEQFEMEIPRRNVSIFVNHYEAGHYYLAVGDFDRAEASFVRATELIPDDPFPWRYRAEIALEKRDDPAGAAVFAAAALDIQPDYEQALRLYIAAKARLYDADRGRRDHIEDIIARLEAAGRGEETGVWREFLAQAEE